MHKLVDLFSTFKLSNFRAANQAGVVFFSHRFEGRVSSRGAGLERFETCNVVEGSGQNPDQRTSPPSFLMSTNFNFSIGVFTHFFSRSIHRTGAEEGMIVSR